MPAGFDRRSALALALVSALPAGCAAPVAGPRAPSSPRAPLRLAVGEIVAGDGPPPLPLANFIDERRSRELTETLRERLRARLVPAGGAPIARFDLEQVSLVERLAAGRRGGVAGLVGREPTFAQEGAIAVRIRILDAAGQEVAQTRVAVQRARSLPAGSSVTTRDEGARALAADLLAQFDDALEVAARDNLGPWLAE